MSPMFNLFYCRISKLGSGSDFEAYFIRLGIAAGRARYTKNKVGFVQMNLQESNMLSDSATLAVESGSVIVRIFI